MIQAKSSPKPRRVRTLAAILALLLLAAPAFPQAQPALPQGVTRAASVEGITEYQLQNGLRVLLFPDQTKSTITVNVTYMVGSRHESYGETGMAHLLEHMLFMGSKNHADIKKELADHGAAPNGSTSFDRTNYYETFQASDDNLKWALAMEADRMVNSHIRKEDLDREMTVVRNEYESGENSPTSVLFKRVLGTAFQWHNYGKSTIGERSDIERVPINRLQDFYRHFYQPDNAVLVVAGKIDEPATLNLVAQTFGPIAKPTRELRRTYTTEPTQDGERAVTLRRVGETQALMAVYHVPPGSHDEFAAVDMASEILGDVPSGRLHKALVETRKAASVSMGSFQLREPGVAILSAEVRKDNSIDEARSIALQVVEEVKTKKFTSEELERVRLQSLKQFDLFMNNSQAVAMNLSEWQSMGDWRMMFIHRDRIKAVTLEQVQAAAEKYFIASNRTVGVFLPEEKPVRAEIPEAPAIEPLVKDYKGRELLSQGEAFDPSYSNIDKRTVNADLGGGLKLTMLPKKTRGDQVIARINFRLGDAESLKGQDAAGQFAGSMLRRGTSKRTRQQINDEFDRLKANVSIGGSPTGAFASITTTRENLKPVLDLVAEILKDPSFPESEFEQLRQQYLAGIERSKAEPGTIAGIAMERHLNPYPKDDVRYVDTLDESAEKVKALKLDEIKAFYKNFYGASAGEISIVGDFDAESTQQQLASLFNTWKSPKKYVRIDRPFQKIEPKQEAFNTPDKANAVWLAAIPFRMKDDHPDYPALIFGNFILGQQPLNNRLFARIRNKEGLSYGVRSSVSVGALDDGATFMAQAICAPQNAPKVEAAFKDELTKILNEGYSAEEVEAAKNAWKQRGVMSRSQDGALAGDLAGNRFLNRTMQWDAKLEEKVLALTPQQIQAAMKKYLDLNNMSFYRAGDFEKAQVKW